MRFMILRKAGNSAEGLPNGIQLGSTGARVRFSARKPTVLEGVPSGKAAVAALTIIDVDSKQAAIDWVKHLPDRGGDEEIEIREGGCPGGVPAVSRSKSSGAQSGDASRFIVMLKADEKSEAGLIADEPRLAAMVKHNDAAVRSGVMLAGEGLQPSARGARVKFSGGKPAVIDGPFAEAKELVAGFWLIQVKSKDEAIEWVKRYPYPFDDGEVEIREAFDA
jgi:hypothetical protein